MAYIRADVKVPPYERTITTHLYFPTDLPEDVGNKVKGVITLLHGFSNNSNDWMMMSAACRYAADNGYILVAPSAENSFYCDMAFGGPFYTIFTKALPEQLHSIFHIPTAREINYIAGLSMGGHGAMHLGLSQPERYAAIGCFSGALHIKGMAQAAKTDPLLNSWMEPVLGIGLEVPDHTDIAALLHKTAQLPKEQQPRIFCTYGRQDPLYPHSQYVRKAVEGLPLDFTYREWDGVHEWNFWDRSLAEFIGFVQNSDYGERKRADWNASWSE